MTRVTHYRGRNRPAVQQGFSLIELMIAMLVGLIVVGSAGSIFIANQRTYAATEVVGRVQESARVAFELMARDIREAAAVPCAKDIPIANVLGRSRTGNQPPPAEWQFNFSDGVMGYESNATMSGLPSSGAGSRYPGTDAIELHGGTDVGVTVETHHAPSAQFKVNKGGFIKDGDIVMVCDFQQASIFQVTNAGNNLTVVHNAGGSTSPGNCTKALGYPVDCDAQCTGASGSSGGGNKGGGNKGGGTEPEPSNSKSCKEFGRNSMVVRFGGIRWYVGRNAQGRGSLYRINSLSSTPVSGGGMSDMPEEITDGVEDMELTYLQDGQISYVDASAVTDWKRVKAVRVVVTLERKDAAATQGTGDDDIARQLNYVVTIRNRVD